MDKLACLENTIYDAIPHVDSCVACGKCCVNVYVTMIEYVFMFHALSKKHSHDILIAILNKPLKPHPDIPGYFVCRFLDRYNKCVAYEGRGFACRFCGHPALDKMYNANCFKKKVSADDYWRMREELETIDTEKIVVGY